MAPTIRMRRIAASVASLTALSVFAHSTPAYGQSELSPLVQAVTKSENELQELQLEMGKLREDGNKSLVDLRTAQVEAHDARQAVKDAYEKLEKSKSDMADAQAKLNELASALYRSGHAPLATADSVDKSLEKRTYLRQAVDEQQLVVDTLDYERTNSANSESMLRKAAEEAETREREAADAESNARETINTNEQALAEKEAQREQLIQQLNAARSELAEARGVEFEEEAAPDAPEPQEVEPVAEEDEREVDVPGTEVAEEVASQQGTHASFEDPYVGEDETDQIIADALETVAEQPVETTVQLTTAPPTPTSSVETETQTAVATPTVEPTPELSTETEPVVAPETTSESTTVTSTETTSQTATSAAVSGDRAQQIETVIARARAQIGVPYVWGGGTATGPSAGLRDGGIADLHGDYAKTGFDCSGLVLYAFAGVGIDLPHYTGYQFQRGTPVPLSEMQRGDLIFWGPGGSNHVAIYLGDGMMLEAPNSGSYVQESPVRWSGISPHAVRLI